MNTTVTRSQSHKPGHNYYVGTVFRHGENILFVLSQSARHIREDGMSFGLDDDSGWLVTLTCRLATAEEARPVLLEEEHERARQELHALKRRLFRPEDGEYVTAEAQLRLDGIRLPWGDRLMLHGGDEEFRFTEAGEIWHLIRNNADGDDWNQNNVTGAIGHRYQTTPERLAFLRKLPGGEHLGMTPEERRKDTIRCYRSRIQDIRPELAELFHEDPLDAVHPGPAVWQSLREPAGYDPPLVGMDPNGTEVYLAVSYYGGSLPNAPPPYEHDIWCRGSQVFLKYAATPERITAIRSLWPSWIGTTQAGCFVLRQAFGCVCENAPDALRYADSEKCPISSIEVTPDVQLLYASPGTEAGKKGVLMWSDGKLTVVHGYSGGLCFRSSARHDPMPEPYRTAHQTALLRAGFPEVPPAAAFTKDLSAAAVELLTIALGQAYWRKNRRFARLFAVAQVHKEQIHTQAAQQAETTLTRITVRYHDDHSETLWLVHHVTWYLGEDGDVNHENYLYETRQEAGAKIAALRS